MSYADKIFKQNVKDILEYGVSDENQRVRPRWEDGTPAHTIALFGITNRYNLAEEFPIITVRRSYWRSAWDEISWIWQKKSNNINELNSHVWDEWADETGSIGKAYGYQMGQKSRFRDVTAEGIKKAFGEDPEERIISVDENGCYMLDQVDRVIYQLVNNPASRRILTNMYNVHDLYDMALEPCAYSMTFMVMDNKLNAILNQRSQDMITANNWNVIQASMLVYAFASAYGFEPGELLHCIGNCHIYTRHIDIAKDLLQKPEFDAPKLWIDPDIRDFYQFTKNSFRLDNYQYNEFNQKIPIAI